VIFQSRFTARTKKQTITAGGVGTAHFQGSGMVISFGITSTISRISRISRKHQKAVKECYNMLGNMLDMLQLRQVPLLCW